MAKSPRHIPNHYPEPLAALILKAETYRQASILRQEIVTDLIEIVTHITEPGARRKLIHLIERNLRAGLAAVEKAEKLWPDEKEAQQILQEKCSKPATAQKHLKLFKEFDQVTKKSLQLLHESHANIQIILEKLNVPTAQATG